MIEEEISHRQRRTMLIMLLLIFISNYLDRQILSVLLPQIKAEFGLSDSRIGLLTGFSFALFYVVAGIPLARLADRGGRVRLLSICCAVWSLFTVACAAAVGFWTLLLARIGVGIGEAGCSPTSHSLIADRFPIEKRASALAIYSTAVPIASLIGLSAGGLLAEALGWRWTLVIVGLPGILLAVLAQRLLTEPAPTRAAGAVGSSFRACVERLVRTRSLVLMACAASLESMAGFGTMMWLPSFLVRSFDFTLTGAGVLLGLVAGAGGLCGILLAGYMVDRLGRTDRRWNCLMPACLTAMAFVTQGAALSVQNPILTGLLFILPIAVMGASGGPINAAVQSVAPRHMRATAAAILMLVLNLIGYGLGPTIVGMVSDGLAGRHGADSLRYALLAITAAYLGASLLYLAASRFLRADIAAADAATEAVS